MLYCVDLFICRTSVPGCRGGRLLLVRNLGDQWGERQTSVLIPLGSDDPFNTLFDEDTCLGLRKMENIFPLESAI
jgi:hypothetical protein